MFMNCVFGVETSFHHVRLLTYEPKNFMNKFNKVCISVKKMVS